MDLNFSQKILVLGLITLSFLLFCKRFGRIVFRIRRAKSESEFKLTHFGKRCWFFFWEVLCQAKVIEGRPLPGVAHAFLLWGFIAFLIAEIDHVAFAFDHSFIDRESAAGLFYYWFVFLFAFCCTLSIAGLAFRRYIVRSPWLDPINWETNLTLALIFIVMITLLPRWWISDTSATGRSLWWFHTVALLALIPLIPRGKNLHVLLSPFALFLKREGFGQIAPLKNTKDLGLYSGREITRITALQAYSCVECGRCTEACPAYNTGKELDPRLIALGLNYYLDEYGPRSASPILDVAVSPKAVFECTTCGACETSCPAGIQHLSMIVGLRRGAVNSGAWKDASGAQLFANLLQHGNAMGAPEAERERFIARQDLPIFDGSQEYCLWLGCMGAYDPHGQAIISSFAVVMRHLGTTFGVLSKEYCTGDPARRLGNDGITKELAEINLKLLRYYRTKKIVSICPHCVRTIAEDWNQLYSHSKDEKEIALDATIEHHSEFLARHADLLPKEESGPRVAFHDPCYLGRYRNVYDDPRKVIARSGTLVEPVRTREKSFCCGAGGGLVFLADESGERINEERAKELVATGADVVATACPFCTAVLRDAMAEEPVESSPQFLDIAQIMDRMIEEQNQP
jgi:Fe-S oxidoreductase